MNIRNVKTMKAYKPRRRQIRKPRRLRLNDRLPKTDIGSETSIRAVIAYPVTSGNHSVRHIGGGRHITAKSTRAYYHQVAHQIREAGMQFNFAGPLSVEYQLFPPDQRERDTCNAQKVFKDALTKAGFWFDDSNKVIRREVIEWGVREKGEDARVIVTVRGYQP